MVSNGQKMGGYDCKFVEDPPDVLKCLICLSVTRDPQQHGDCGKLFCNSCITEHRKISNACPHCRQNLVTFNDGRSAQEVKSLKVKCDNGCQWVGELRSLEEHLQKCENPLIPCPNHCKIGEQTVYVLRKNLDDHLINQCPRRQHACKHCKKMGEFQERTTVHLKTCPKVMIQCTSGCKTKVKRKNLQKHLIRTCPKRQYQCPHCGEVGEYQERTTTHLQICLPVPCPNQCKSEVRRKNLQKHLDTECPRRQYPCPHCGEVGEYQERITTHLDTCKRALTTCLHCNCRVHTNKLQKHLTSKCPRRPYSCKHCGEVGPHQEITLAHLKTCPMVKVQCPNLPCPAMIARCAIDLHQYGCKYATQGLH